MAPLIIDLKSSPEPEQSPQTTARAALDAFRQQKQTRGDVQSTEAQQTPQNGRELAKAISGVTQAIQTERHQSRDNGQRYNGIETGVHNSVKKAQLLRHQHPRRDRIGPEEGSLAFLLQQELAEPYASSTSSKLMSRQAGDRTTNPPSAQHSPLRDSEANRASLLRSFQRQQNRTTPGSRSTAPAARETTEDPLRLPNAIDLEQHEFREVVSYATSKNLEEVTRHHKRRRIERPSAPNALSGGPSEGQYKVLTPAKINSSPRDQSPRDVSKTPSSAAPTPTPTKALPSHSSQQSANVHAVLSQRGLHSVSSKQQHNGYETTRADPHSRRTITDSKIASSANHLEGGGLESLTSERRNASQDVEGAGSESESSASDPSETSVEGVQVPAETDPRRSVEFKTHIRAADKTDLIDTGPRGINAAQATPSKSEIYESDISEKKALEIISKTTSGEPYSADEDELLRKLKEVDNLSWEEIHDYFQGRRTRGSLQVRYSTRVKSGRGPPVTRANVPHVKRVQEDTRSLSPNADLRDRPRRKRNNDPAVTTGFVSWADVKRRRQEQESEEVEREDESESRVKFVGERAYSKPLTRILRQRELGSNFGRSWTPNGVAIPEELKEHVSNDLGPRKYYKGTSGDVICLAWSPNGENFAAGSIAITDERSMQYNRPYNLLFGRVEESHLQELPEHYIRRPKVGSKNLDSGETQDPRLFMTVAGVGFSPDSKVLYSAGSDRRVRAYQVDRDSVSYMYTIEHVERIDLLSVGNSGALATACHHSADNSIGVFQGRDRVAGLSPKRGNEQTDREIYPSALKWGAAQHHSNLLLAGFSIDSIDDERNIAGETCLWDVRTQNRIEVIGVTRNVFDVAWNPSPSSASTIFAVASSRGTERVSKGTRSVVQCFAPSQNRAKRVVELECPGFDINAIVYCQHDDRLLAAGATDGKVYIWDQRFVNRGSEPLHIFEHGATLNVLDHDLDREIADTGVQFLSWGATGFRLYTGSSDGIVKIWNTYRSTEDAHVKDVATFDSAVMSGTFSPDYRDLLIGEDQGRINLLSVGYGQKAVRSMQKLDLRCSNVPAVPTDCFAAARELRETGQISIRPMGPLPKRQAVQGPRYRGPYLRPSEEEQILTNSRYEEALNKQNEAEVRKARGEPSLVPDKSSELWEATKKVQEAQEDIVRMQKRIDDVLVLEPMARANQQLLARRANERAELELSSAFEQCSLDCNYLPTNIDESGEVPDSGRSELRIPGMLRYLKSADTSDWNEDERPLQEVAAACMSCRAPAKKPQRKSDQTLCEKCRQTRMGLTMPCKLCSNRTRPGSSNSDLCESCNFSCFRCAQPAIVSNDLSKVTCSQCKRSWEIGVLGYAPAGRQRRAPLSSQPSNEGDENEEFGHREIERYAGRWQT